MCRERHDEKMNCDWVERHLSAYHDRMLDVEESALVERHLTTCSHCQQRLEELVWFDEQIAHLPRVGPSPALRERIFSSPEFRALISTEEEIAPEVTPSPPAPVLSRPMQVVRSLVGVAAVLLIIAGAALIYRTILARTVGCLPSASGSHLVTSDSNGVLLSDGQELLCNHAIIALSWQVSPDGHQIAYVAQPGGNVYVIGADGSNNRLLYARTGSDAPVSMLSWSPNTRMLAVGMLGSNGIGRVVTVDVGSGALDTWWDSANDQLVAGPVWSPNGDTLAYALKAAGNCSPCLVLHSNTSANDVNIATQQTPGQLAWYGGQLTWTTSHDGLSSIDMVDSADAAHKVITVYSARDLTLAPVFAPATGRWAVAGSDGTIRSISLAGGAPSALTTLQNVTALAWSPDGTALVAQSQGTAWLITGTDLRRPIATITDNAAITWSPDGYAIAFSEGSTAHIVAIGSDASTTITAANPLRSLAWSPVNHLLTIWDGAAASTYTLSGQLRTRVSSAAAPAWTVSGS